MIKLAIEDYCQNCEKFRPIAEVYYRSKNEVNTAVYCKFLNICNLAYEYGYNEGRKDEELAQEENK